MVKKRKKKPLGKLVKVASYLRKVPGKMRRVRVPGYSYRLLPKSAKRKAANPRKRDIFDRQTTKRKREKLLEAKHPKWGHKRIEVTAALTWAYTFKIMALATGRERYRMSFNPDIYAREEREDSRTLEMFQTRWFPEVGPVLMEDLRKHMDDLEKAGLEEILSIELCQVTREGIASEREWLVLGEWTDPHDIPGYPKD